MRLIDAELLHQNIEDRIDELSSEAVKGGLRVALKMIEDQPAVPLCHAYVDAEKIAEKVAEILNHE